MAIAPTTDTPRSAVDARGRLLPRSEAERKAHSAELARALDAMDALTDDRDTDEVWAEVYRGIDAGRPHRPLFEGQY